MSAKIKAKGIIVKYSAEGTTYNAIPQHADASLDLGSWDREEKTTHDTVGSTKEYDVTMKEPASIDVSVLLDPADTHHAAIQTAFLAGTLLYWDFVLPDTGAASYKFTGNVTSFKITPALKGFLNASFTVSGASATTFSA